MADTEGSLRATWVAAERRRHSMRWTSCAAPAHAFQVAPVTALVSASHVHAIEETGDQSQGRHKCKICKAVSAGAFGIGVGVVSREARHGWRALLVGPAASLRAPVRSRNRHRLDQRLSKTPHRACKESSPGAWIGLDCEQQNLPSLSDTRALYRLSGLVDRGQSKGAIQVGYVRERTVVKVQRNRDAMPCYSRGAGRVSSWSQQGLLSGTSSLSLSIFVSRLRSLAFFGAIWSQVDDRVAIHLLTAMEGHPLRIYQALAPLRRCRYERGFTLRSKHPTSYPSIPPLSISLDA